VFGCEGRFSFFVVCPEEGKQITAEFARAPTPPQSSLHSAISNWVWGLKFNCFFSKQGFAGAVTTVDCSSSSKLVLNKKSNAVLCICFFQGGMK